MRVPQLLKHSLHNGNNTTSPPFTLHPGQTILYFSQQRFGPTKIPISTGELVILHARLPWPDSYQFPTPLFPHFFFRVLQSPAAVGDTPFFSPGKALAEAEFSNTEAGRL